MNIERKLYPLVSSVESALKVAAAERKDSPRPLSLVVAVSGGKDSHVLLHAIVSLKERFPLKVIAAHVNHGLRSESGMEAMFVQELAARYEIPFLLYSAPTKPASENLEAWAREVRYGFLEEARVNSKADFIVTAHHQNDQAETLLFRIVSGRLTSDAHTIARIDQQRHLLRPLLDVNRDLIRKYQEHFGLEVVFDKSNNDLNRTRNRMRHELIPLLEKTYNPQIAPSLAELAERLNADEDFLERSAEAIASSAANDLPTALKGCDPALRWRVVRAYARRQPGMENGRFGYQDLQTIVGMLLDGSGEERVIEVGGGVEAKIYRASVSFDRKVVIGTTKS